MSNDFKEYRIHILSELQELKEGQQRQDRDHALVKESLTKITSSLTKLQNDQKWHIRIASGVWAVIVLGVDALLRKW